MTSDAADTIVGQATPPGEGGVGIVRMSGPHARAIAERLCPGLVLAPWRIRHARLVDPATREGIDEVLVSFMQAPRSYTREDVVEINCHGGQVPVARALSLCMREGARLARPGEFTRRAFLGGRIDLAQAEAVLDLIRARTEEAERLALGQLAGGLSREVLALRERLASALAHLEAHIDFPEDEIAPRDARELREAVAALAGDIEALAATFDDGRLFREGVRTAIVGRPNVGKSSLLNALLGRDRAIVTPMPGTTRDVIEETLNIGGLPLVIMDTAGIREAHDMAEAEGVRRSMRAIEEADLVLLAVESSAPLHEADRGLLDTTRNRKSVLVLTKADLPRSCGAVEDARPTVEVSALTGGGLDALRGAIRGACLTGAGGEARAGVLVTALRHREALDRAAHALREALGGLGSAPYEITALDLRAALDALGEIVGAVTTDEILDRIFSEFCIGK